jgi:hypothetical protein
MTLSTSSEPSKHDAVQKTQLKHKPVLIHFEGQSLRSLRPKAKEIFRGRNDGAFKTDQKPKKGLSSH